MTLPIKAIRTAGDVTALGEFIPGETLDDAIISLGNVTQHQTGLSVGWGQLTDVPATFAPSAHDHLWGDVTGTPTTLAGYGITDAALAGHAHAFADVTAKPTTLAGYGITDAAALSHTQAASTITAGVFGAGAYVFPGSLSVTGALTPATDNTYALGSASLRWSNVHAQAVTISGAATMSSTLAVTSSVSASEYRIAGLRVVGPRIGGWASLTGQSSRVGFDSETVTVAVLARHVRALIEMANTHGLIATDGAVLGSLTHTRTGVALYTEEF